MPTKSYVFPPNVIWDYAAQLRSQERAPGTIDNYLRHIHAYIAWLNGRETTKELVTHWKEQLISKGYTPTTINSMLASLNSFFDYLGWTECRVKALRLQKRLFRDTGRELTRRDYERLLDTAEQMGKSRLALLMEAICSTGIRVSEVKYLTVEAAQCGRADISLKGKIRTILIPGKLCRKMLKYAQKNKIASGEIFLTRNGTSLSRKQIWAEMKELCRKAGVADTKVFPHNLRHLFARCFYRACRDVAKLADVLGHSSIETTRIYLISTGAEHARTLDRLRLIS